jgi:transcriptional regulator with XRE-family HTH domain
VRPIPALAGSGQCSTLAKVSAEGAKRETRLAYWRKKRGMSQFELARVTGLTRSTYWRLEQGEYENPKLRSLVNLAIALDCPNGIEDIAEPEWLRWTVFDVEAPGPPAAK